MHFFSFFLPHIASCKEGAFFGTSPPEAAAKRVGGRAKTWGVWGGSPHMQEPPRERGASSSPPLCEAAAQKGSAHPPLPSGGVLAHAAACGGNASFVQRMPSDSEKRQKISPHEGGEPFGTTMRGSTAKRVGGRAKTWGVWGVSPHMQETRKRRGVGDPATAGAKNMRDVGSVGIASFVQRTPSDSAACRRGKSFVQRTPNDSAKRTDIPRECGVASWHKTVPRGTAKRVGGRAKTWGVWGVSPQMGGFAPHMQAKAKREA